MEGQMQEVCIEKGIPMPTQGRGFYKRLADNMEVGDSVLFTDDLGAFGNQRWADVRATSLIQRLKAMGMKGSKRLMNSGTPKQVRVWRTE